MSEEKSNQTAIDWYCNEMENLRVDSEINNMKAHEFLIKRAEIFEQAKQMEIKQNQEYAEFCIHCDRSNLPLLDFEGFINLKSEE